MGVSVGFVCYVSARHEGDQVLTACVGWWNVFRGMLVCGRLLFFADLPVCVTQIRLVSESVVELVYSGGLITQYNFYWKTLLRTLRSGCYMHRLLHDMAALDRFRSALWRSQFGRCQVGLIRGS